MAQKEGKYNRLPGRSINLFDAKSLWRGDNHLLYVESFFFRETYKRFGYNDIQTILLQRTSTHLVWSFIWGALALLCGIIAFLVPDTPYVSSVFFVLFFIVLIANFIMGPTCVVYLQTAVQLQKLASLRRVRTASKVVTSIKSLVEETQGQWDRNKSTAAQRSVLQNKSNAAAQPSATVVHGTMAETQEPVGQYNPLMHQVLFGFFTCLGLLGGIQILLKSLPVGLLETMLHAVAQILVIVALVRWFRHLKGTLIAKFNWVAVVFIVIQTIIGYGLYMFVSIQNPEINYHHWAMFKMIFELQMSDHHLALAGNIIFSGGSLLIGVFGLLAINRYKNNRLEATEAAEPLP